MKAYPEFELHKQQLLETGDYESYLMCFGGHNRLRPFLDILPRLNDRQFWELCRFVWQTDDFWKLLTFDGHIDILNHRKKLYELLRSTRSCRKHFISDKERSQLECLPEIINVYRGFNLEGFDDGFSWTTDIGVAKWFSERYGGHTIISGKCAKDNVIGYLLDRKEFEIVVDPQWVSEKVILKI